MKIPTWIAWICWIATIGLCLLYLNERWPALVLGQSNNFDVLAATALIIAFLSTLFTELRLPGGSGFKRPQTQGSHKVGSVPPAELAPGGPGVVPPEAPASAPERSRMEYKILNTLWTKQVNRYDEWLKGVAWTFRINFPSIEFVEWREAAGKLIRERLVVESDHGQIYITHAGFDYCRKHYREFGQDQFWPEEQIKTGKLQQVVAER